MARAGCVPIGGGIDLLDCAAAGSTRPDPPRPYRPLAHAHLPVSPPLRSGLPAARLRDEQPGVVGLAGGNGRNLLVSLEGIRWRGEEREEGKRVAARRRRVTASSSAVVLYVGGKACSIGFQEEKESPFSLGQIQWLNFTRDVSWGKAPLINYMYFSGQKRFFFN